MEKQSLPQRIRGGYLEALLNSSPHAIVAIDAEGTMTFVNKQTCGLSGYEMRELIGENITLVYGDPDAARETNRKLYLSGGIIHDQE